MDGRSVKSFRQGMLGATEGTCPHCDKPLQAGAAFCQSYGRTVNERPRGLLAMRHDGAARLGVLPEARRRADPGVRDLEH